MKHITPTQAARLVVLVIGIIILHVAIAMLKWAMKTNANDLEFRQLLQLVIVLVAGFSVVQFVMVIRSFKYPNN